MSEIQKDVDEGILKKTDLTPDDPTIKGFEAIKKNLRAAFPELSQEQIWVIERHTNCTLPLPISKPSPKPTTTKPLPQRPASDGAPHTAKPKAPPPPPPTTPRSRTPPPIPPQKRV